MKKLNFFAAIFLLMLSCEAYTQTSINNFNFSMTYFSTGEVRHTYNPIPDGGRIIDRYDSVYARVCIIDPAAFVPAKIHVNVGTQRDSSDVFNYIFNWNDSLNLPQYVSYSAVSNKVYLGLFETIKTDMYYYKVRFEGINGELSEPKYFY
jgi:hypothetical protein